jgi:protein-S-isoprenylcysteine O-methyltransferase Ste14
LKKDRFIAYLLVSVQFAAVIMILVSGGLFAKRLLLLAVEIAGLTLGIWALAVMGRHNLNVTPLVKQDAQLVTKGPYAVIRHPMYAAVLLTIWPLILDQYSLFRLIAGIVLTGDLIVKMLYEESLLKRNFEGYAAYMRNTKRLIPFVL